MTPATISNNQCCHGRMWSANMHSITRTHADVQTLAFMETQTCRSGGHKPCMVTEPAQAKTLHGNALIEQQLLKSGCSADRQEAPGLLVSSSPSSSACPLAANQVMEVTCELPAQHNTSNAYMEEDRTQLVPIECRPEQNRAH